MVEIIRNTRPPAAHPESDEHSQLKELAVTIIRELGAQKIIVEAEKHIGVQRYPKSFTSFIDVVGEFPKHQTIAIECGNCSKERIAKLKKHFTIVVHLPYCHTPQLVTKSPKAIIRKN